MPQQSFLRRTGVAFLLLVVSACLVSSFAWETSASAVPRHHRSLQRRVDDYTESPSSDLSSEFAVDEMDTSTTPGSAIQETVDFVDSGGQAVDYGVEAVNSGDEVVDSGDEMVGINMTPSTTVTSTAIITAPTQTVLLPFTTVPALPSSAPITYDDTTPAGASIRESPKTTLGGYDAGSADVNISTPPVSILQGNGATPAGILIPKPSGSALEGYGAAPAGTVVPEPSISVLTDGYGVSPAGVVDPEPSVSVQADATAAQAGGNIVDPLETDNEVGGTAPADGPTPQPSVQPTAITGTEPVGGVDNKHPIVPSSLDELTPEQQESVKEFTAVMCAEVACDYNPSDVCPDAANDPCIKLEDALKSPTFTETYERAQKEVAAEEEERRKKEDDDGGNDGKDGKNSNGRNDNSDDGDDNGDDDDDDDHLGRNLGLGLGLGIPGTGAIGASAYGKIAGKAWWPPSVFNPEVKGDGSQGLDPKPNPEPAPGPGAPPLPGIPVPPVGPPPNVAPPPPPGIPVPPVGPPPNVAPPTPGTPVPPAGPPPSVEPPINYTPEYNAESEIDEEPEQEEEEDCQGELTRKTQEFNELKTRYDKLEKDFSQEGASDYNKVKQDLREWQDAAQKALEEQERVKKDLKNCQNTLKDIETAEPDSAGKGKGPTQKMEDLERKVTSLEAAKHAADQARDECRMHDTEVSRELWKCRAQREGCLAELEASKRRKCFPCF